MPRLRSLTLFLGLSSFLGACQAGTPQTTPEPPDHALAGMVAQRLVVLPTYLARVVAPLTWSIGRPAELQNTMDADISAAIDERGIRSWYLPAALEQSFRSNPTYATDPHHLDEEPLRSGALAVDARLPDPLASQIRTLVALHSDARYVLAPVELRVERVGVNKGRGVLRLVLMDARMSNVRWIGEVASDTLESFGPALSASLASHLANVLSPR